MKKISKQIISNYRKKLRLLIIQLEQKAFRSIYPNLLFQGSPTEIFRTCGNKKCKCAKGGTNRHGPYKVIQVQSKGKQKQLVLRKGREGYYEMAKLYVWNIKNLQEVRNIFYEVDILLKEVINLRTIKEIEDGE